MIYLYIISIYLYIYIYIYIYGSLQAPLISEAAVLAAPGGAVQIKGVRFWLQQAACRSKELEVEDNTKHQTARLGSPACSLPATSTPASLMLCGPPNGLTNKEFMVQRSKTSTTPAARLNPTCKLPVT